MPSWFSPLVCAVLFATAAAAQAGDIEVTKAWARGTPAGADTGAAYLTLQSSTADRLTGISTTVAKKAELHTMSMDGTVMKMRGLDSVDLPAGQAVTLKPGGMHIMLLGLNQPLKPGETFPLTLQFASGGTRQVQVEVEKLGAMGPAQPTGGTPMPTPGPGEK